MQVLIQADNTLPLPTALLCERLNSVCRTIQFSAPDEPLRIPSRVLTYPLKADLFTTRLLDEIRKNDFAFLCTNIAYEDNYFFHGAENYVLISFSGWQLLTDLPVSNGLVYFVASVFGGRRHRITTHEHNTGCINDFWWDKRGVDAGMRAAYICAQCREVLRLDEAVLGDLQRLLDLVSSSSRARQDVIEAAYQSSANVPQFDVFLCHNSSDKPEIRKINAFLKAAAIRTWLDEEQARLGQPWQPELERQIGLVKSACVFVGSNGWGPWQQVEERAFLEEFVRRGCPVIPVILPGTEQVPALPLFLRQMTWLDLREDYQGELSRLVSALKEP